VAQKYGVKQAGFWGSAKEFVGLLLLVLAIRVFLFGLYQVPTPSMETTMLVGERFFADKLSYFFRSPNRGEIISFNEPEFKYSTNPVLKLLQSYVFGPFPSGWGPDNWTKRVIGIPGDHVEGRVENGKPVVYLNGERLDEPYTNKYPLVHVWRQDPKEALEKLREEIYKQFGSQNLDQNAVERFAASKLEHYLQCDLRSYDPSVSYGDQPFYRIDPNLLNEQDGQRVPGSLIRPNFTETQVHGNNNFWNGSDVFSVHLGNDEYWCMGDNRLGSKDCRFFGPIKGEWIHGRILFRIWSIDSNESWWILDLIKHPVDFWKRVRWTRFFQWVH